MPFLPIASTRLSSMDPLFGLCVLDFSFAFRCFLTSFSQISLLLFSGFLNLAFDSNKCDQSRPSIPFIILFFHVSEPIRLNENPDPLLPLKSNPNFAPKRIGTQSNSISISSCADSKDLIWRF
ncbi:hypothetical protein ACFX2J_032880 [Malus domestica]